MSNGTDESPQHASLPTRTCDLRSPPYVDVATDTVHSQHSTPGYHDEEAQCGFWGEDTSTADEKEYSVSGWEKFVYTVLQVLLVIVIGLNLDVIISKWGVGSMDWSGGAKAHSAGTIQVHFCLADVPRGVASQRVWRIITSDSLDQCESETLTLNALAPEASKLGLLDEIFYDPNEI